MSEQTKEVGVIGQKYEDRKNPAKCGVLVSRDEKYKTLLLDGDDGKSISVTFSTFKSAWRKCKSDDVEVVESVDEIKPESVKTDEPVVVEFETAPVSIKSKRDSKKFNIADDEQKERYNQILNEVTMHIQEGDILLKVNSRTKFGGIVIKEGRQNQFELWVLSDPGKVDLWISDSILSYINFSNKYDYTVVEREIGKLNRTVQFSGIDVFCIDALLKEILVGYKAYKESLNLAV